MLGRQLTHLKLYQRSLMAMHTLVRTYRLTTRLTLPKRWRSYAASFLVFFGKGLG